MQQGAMRETILEENAELFGKPLEVPRPIGNESPLVELKKSCLLPRNEGILRIFYDYGKLVELYTAQQLKIPADNLNAFSGILRVLAGHLGNTFMSGFPAASPYLVLLWTSVHLVTERKLNNHALIEMDEVIPFPIWSLAGWLVAVEYRLL
ncbi:hypothetical protein I7I48_10451 [Histoplasma ohiense]|nr:hypothetical protein I7I48_10451 [Histoplasma ohiense (nom. inval.)]